MTKITKAPPAWKIAFLEFVELHYLPAPVEEHRFHPTRKWRFDMAWVREKIAIEVDGGAWSGGRHTRGAGFIKDHEKLNAATVLGWRVLRYTPSQMMGSQPIKDVLAIHDYEPDEARRKIDGRLT
jgi:very-short-patch-repair endonuclease